MRSISTCILALLLLPLAAGCSGNIGDLFSIFPPEAFEPPGDGGGGGGTTFTPREVARIGGSQGVTGSVRNVAVTTIAGSVYAFIAAGPDGVHVVDVTDPLVLNSTDYVTTIRDTRLSDPDAAVAGARVDAVAIVDGNFLVCLAVATGAANAVTVFSIPILIEDAVSPTADLSRAFVPLTGTGIAAPGNSAGKAGGVAGSGGRFFVATGGPMLQGAMIDTGTSTWTETGALEIGTTIGETLDVRVNQTTSIYVSTRTVSGAYGIVARGHPALPLPSTPEFFAIAPSDPAESTSIDNFNLSSRTIAGRGNFPVDLAIDGLTLLATGNAKVFVYNITNPFAPSLISTIGNTGSETIAVAGEGGVVAIGAGTAVVLGQNALGQARTTGRVDFTGGTFAVRGVAILSTDDGTFALCCAGDQGLRVVQVSQRTS
jgi:hypothetical protein